MVHMASIHFESNGYLECEICSASFSFFSNLKTHMKTSHSDRVRALNRHFACEHCTQRFVRKCDLSRHLNNYCSQKKKE